MRTNQRRTLAFLTSSSLAILTVAASTLSFGQAPSTKQAPARTAPKAPGDPRVTKTQGQGKATSEEVPPKAVVDPAAQRKMEELLVRWETQSKKVKSLKVTFTRTDHSKAFNITTVYQGSARLCPDRIYLDFYEMVGDKKKELFDQQIVSDGENVYQFLGATKQIFVFPLDKDPKVRSLNQGPLPFLFDMSVEKAKARYDMILREDLPTAYIIEIIPKLPIDREEYSKALVKLNKERFLPEAIRLWDPANGKDTKTFSFVNKEDLVENLVIPSDWFDGKKWANHYLKTKDPKHPENNWTIQVNPQGNGAPPRNATAAGGQGAANPKGATPAGPIGSKPAVKGAGGRLK